MQRFAPAPARGPVFRYGLAVASTGLALAGTFTAWPRLRWTPFALFFASTFVSAHLGGRGPGFFAVPLAGGGYLVLLAGGLIEDHRIVPLAVFTALGFLLAWIVVRRNETERTLRASEAQFRTIFEAAPIGIALVDMAGRPVRSNSALHRMLGYRADELAKLTFTTFTHPEDATTDWNLFQELIAGRRDHYHMEKRYRRADGALVWGHLSVALLRGPDGRPIFALGMVEDVTERKRTEQALRASEARFGGILDIAQDAIVSVNEDQQIVLFNKGAERVFGYEARDVLGQSLDILVPRASVLAHHGHVRSFAAASEQARRMGQRREVYGRRKDGTIFPAEASISKLEHEGHLVLTAIVRDISDRREAEELLRRTEERLRLVVAHLPIVLWAIDAEGRFTLSEGKGLDSLGLLPGEVVGRQVQDVYEGVPEIVEATHRALNGESVSFTATVASGSTFECWYSPLSSEGEQVSGAIGVALDVTERRGLQAQLLHAQKMEAIGLLAGGIAHDFNNLLTAIGGYTDLVLESLDEADRRREDLQEVAKATQRAAALTRHLLAVSRRQILEPTIVDPNLLVSDIEKLLRRTIPENIDLRLDLSPAMDPVRADRGQLEQVLLNLAINAGDAMPRGGELRLSTATVDVDEATARHHPPMPIGRYARISVTDTGVGMSPQIQARIFEPFFTTKARGKGTGLGLATVYGIVKQSEGFIWVDSALGRGTTFDIYLPAIHAAAVPALPRLPVLDVTGGTQTILLAEDDGAVRRLARDVLLKAGYTVLDARDGDEALDIARRYERSIHLLIADVVMPGLSGRDLAERLSAERPKIRVLYSSGYTENVIMHAGVEQGLALLPKPFLPADLLRKVHEVLSYAEFEPGH